MSPDLGCDHICLSSLANSYTGFQEALVYCHTRPVAKVGYYIFAEIIIFSSRHRHPHRPASQETTQQVPL